MSYLENKKNTFKNMIGELYYKGCLGYTEIYIIALMYFKTDLSYQEITYKEIQTLVHEEINSLIDLD